MLDVVHPVQSPLIIPIVSSAYPVCPMMSLSIPGYTISTVPATPEGARTIQDIENSANETSPLSRLLWPAHLRPETTADAQAQDDEEISRTVAFIRDPDNRFFLITEDTTNKAVAYVWWQHAKGRTEEEWAEAYANRYRPEGMNKALMDATSGARFLKRAKILGEKDVFSRFHLLSVAEQRRDKN